MSDYFGYWNDPWIRAERERRICTCERFKDRELQEPSDHCAVHRGRKLNDRPLPRVALTTPVVGIRAEQIDLPSLQLGRGEILQARREPDNAVDRNAVQVWTPHSLVGYLPAEIAFRLRHDDLDSWSVVVDEVLQYEGKDAGVRVRLVPREKGAR